MRRLFFITFCLFGLGLLVWLVRQSQMPAPDMPDAADLDREPEPERQPEADPDPLEVSEPVAAEEPAAEHPFDDVVAAAPSTTQDGEQLLAELSRLRAEVIERVERRPLFVMAEQRGVPYFKLFFMTKPELLEAVLEAEGVPPADVRPSPETAARVRKVAAEAYRRHEEIAAEEAAEVRAG